MPIEADRNKKNSGGGGGGVEGYQLLNIVGHPPGLVDDENF